MSTRWDAALRWEDVDLYHQHLHTERKVMRVLAAWLPPACLDISLVASLGSTSVAALTYLCAAVTPSLVTSCSYRKAF